MSQVTQSVVITMNMVNNVNWCSLIRHISVGYILNISRDFQYDIDKCTNINIFPTWLAVSIFLLVRKALVSRIGRDQNNALWVMYQSRERRAGNRL